MINFGAYENYFKLKKQIKVSIFSKGKFKN